MTTSIDKIEQDIATLENKSVEIAQELNETYGQYLEALGQGMQRQLISATYHVCTQLFPDAFLRLSYKQREQLQRSLRRLGQEASQALLLPNLLKKLVQQKAFESKALEILKTQQNAEENLASSTDSLAENRDKLETLAKSQELNQELNIEELQIEEVEVNRSIVDNAHLETQETDNLEEADVDSGQAKRTDAHFDLEEISDEDSTAEVDDDHRNAELSGLLLNLIALSKSRSEPEDKQTPSEDEDSQDPSIHSPSEASRQDPEMLTAREIEAALGDRAIAAIKAALNEKKDRMPNLAVPHTPGNPEALIAWEKAIEYGITELLRSVSYQATKLLEKTKILDNPLPDAVLEAATHSDAAKSAGGPPNLLTLMVEMSNLETDEAEEVQKSAKPIQIVAIYLRAPEIEFTDRTLATWRKKIRSYDQPIYNLNKAYQKKKHELAIAEAQAAWRSSWINE